MTATWRNLLAGLSNSVWSALIGLATVPYYLEYLGIEAYGLIGFYITAQAMLQLLDMGMAPTINREVARCKAMDNIREAGKLLHSLAVIYWSLMFAIAALFFVLSPFIAGYWLQSASLPQETVLKATTLMGCVIAFRLPVGLYQGVLIGAQRLVLSSAINIAMVTLGNVGAIVVLAFGASTIEAFFLWQVGVSIMHAVLTMNAAWRVVGKNRYRFSFISVRRVLGFALGTGAISIIGVVLHQLDKFILSGTLEMEQYGKYMLATMIANALYLFITPVFNIIYPGFSSLIARGKKDDLSRQYRTMIQLVSSFLFPLSMSFALLAQPLIALWTRDGGLSSEIAPIASMILFSRALHGIGFIPYAVMLAHGHMKSALTMYGLLMLVMLPATIALSMIYGVWGGVIAQILLFSLFLFMAVENIQRKYAVGDAQTLVHGICVPMGISMLIGISGYFAMEVWRVSVVVRMLLGAALGIAAVALCVYSNKNHLLLRRMWVDFRSL
ncbi:MAG: oligosaccharide flippase family protein [Zoogloeaceae bacterium]|jgi:O-antigen/teichoic acid export membrane protein|nr:oligosaccharide flippase family protein [Zoogloeaceae bacterium]